MRLAFKFDLYANEPISRKNIYVDALSGAIINDEPLLYDFETFNADTRYSGPRFISTSLINGKYRLYDSTRGKGIEVLNLKHGAATWNATPFEDNDNYWSALEWNNAYLDNVALDALWAAQKFYDYFKTMFGRKGYDDADSKISLYVHWFSGNDRLSWGGGEVMIGDGGVRFKPLVAIDGITHEIGHAISQRAYLSSTNEPSILKEGFADIWAACVEYYAAPEKEEWLIGEEVEKSSSCTRSMINPLQKYDPDKYLGQYWISDPSNEDYAHNNCTVLDHWFYLLSMGGKGVTGIGMNNAAKIVYRLVTAPNLETESGFLRARTGSLLSAKEVFGFNSNHVIQIGKAWVAVGVGGNDYLPVLSSTQITGGSDRVPLNKSNTFFVTPASDPYTISYTWSVIPYNMSCSPANLPKIVTPSTGTQVQVNSGKCTGQFILRCRANNPWAASSYQDRVITVYSGASTLVSDPNPCAPILNVYPNPTTESQLTTLELQYPCVEGVNSSSNNEYELSIYDINGNLTLKENISSDIYTIDNKRLKKNNYVLILKDNKGNQYQKHFSVE
jgi:hypothetical protein